MLEWLLAEHRDRASPAVATELLPTAGKMLRGACIELLLEAGADATCTVPVNFAAWHYGEFEGQEGVVPLLGLVLYRTSRWFGPGGSEVLDSVSALVSAPGVDVRGNMWNLTAAQPRGALSVLLRGGVVLNQDVLELLLEAGADPNGRVIDQERGAAERLPATTGGAAVHVAAEAGGEVAAGPPPVGDTNPPSVPWLDFQDAATERPLALAIANRRWHAALLLVEYGADVDLLPDNLKAQLARVRASAP